MSLAVLDIVEWKLEIIYLDVIGVNWCLDVGDGSHQLLVHMCVYMKYMLPHNMIVKLLQASNQDQTLDATKVARFVHRAPANTDQYSYRW